MEGGIKRLWSWPTRAINGGGCAKISQGCFDLVDHFLFSHQLLLGFYPNYNCRVISGDRRGYSGPYFFSKLCHVWFPNRVFHSRPTWAQLWSQIRPNLFPNLHEVGGKVGQLYCEKLAGDLESKVGTQSWVQVVVTTSIWLPTWEKRPNFRLPTLQNWDQSWDQSWSTSCATMKHPNTYNYLATIIL